MAGFENLNKISKKCECVFKLLKCFGKPTSYIKKTPLVTLKVEIRSFLKKFVPKNTIQFDSAKVTKILYSCPTESRTKMIRVCYKHTHPLILCIRTIQIVKAAWRGLYHLKKCQNWAKWAADTNCPFTCSASVPVCTGHEAWHVHMYI